MQLKSDILRKKYEAGKMTADEYLKQRYKYDYWKTKKVPKGISKTVSHQ